jgi:hypothetical protein
MDDSLARRPSGVSDETVEALGKLSEALETVEQARGHLYAFHQLTGRADKLFAESAGMFADAEQPAWAERIRTEILGLNVLAGRWTFQVVEEFDDGYWTTLREFEREAREKLAEGVRHIFEAEMKQDRITPGRPGQEAVPTDR